MLIKKCKTNLESHFKAKRMRRTVKPWNLVVIPFKFVMELNMLSVTSSDWTTSP